MRPPGNTRLKSSKVLPSLKITCTELDGRVITTCSCWQPRFSVVGHVLDDVLLKQLERVDFDSGLLTRFRWRSIVKRAFVCVP